MARPIKSGIDYFPMDVDIFDDDKIFDLQCEYGPLGEIVYLRLICLIYKNGYYYRFSSLQKLASLVMRSIGARWVDSKELIEEVIKYAVSCELFSRELFEKGILTSKGIQSRFKLATERRKKGILEYSLLDDDVNESFPHSGIGNVENSKAAAEQNVEAVQENKTDDVIDNERVCSIDDLLKAYEHEPEIEDEFSRNVSEEGVSDYSYLDEEMKVPPVVEEKIRQRYFGYDPSEFNSLSMDEIADNMLLLAEEEDHDFFNCSKNEGFCSNNPTKERKEKESKEKESKEKEIKGEKRERKPVEKNLSLSDEDVKNLFNCVCKSLPKVERVTNKASRLIKKAAKKIDGKFDELFLRVENSDFLSGRSGKWKGCSFEWVLNEVNLDKILAGNYDDPEDVRMSGRREVWDDKKYYEQLGKEFTVQ